MAASQRRGREQAAPSGGAEHRRACSQDSPQQHRRPRLVTLPLSAQPLSAPPMRGIRSTGLPSRSFNATPRKSGRDMLSNRSKQTASRQVHSSSSRWGGAPVAVSSGASALTDTHARTQPTKRCTPHQQKAQKAPKAPACKARAKKRTATDKKTSATDYSGTDARRSVRSRPDHSWVL